MTAIAIHPPFTCRFTAETIFLSATFSVLTAAPGTSVAASQRFLRSSISQDDRESRPRNRRAESH